MYGRIAPRSGLAYKYGIDVLAGVIDSDYRWDIGVLLINLWDTDVQIEKWERIAQFILEKCFDVEWKELDDLDESERADGWFGSTGRF
jgi:dUTP pyrophosphatase